MSKDNGGQAFPRVVEQPNGYMQAVEGMSLRDYFAAKAMHGYVSDPGFSGTLPQMEHTAEFAYRMADAMMKAREK